MTRTVEYLSQWSSLAFLALIAAALLLVVVYDWRVRLAALTVQYVSAAILVAQIVLPVVAIVKLVGGLLVVLILALSAADNERRLAAGEPAPQPDSQWRRLQVPTGLPFRGLAALMATVAALSLSAQPGLGLPGLQVAPAVNSAAYLLMVLGLLNLGLTEEPLRAGMGLLTLFTGFGVFYAALEPSLAIVALLAAVDFGIALAASYLAAIQTTAPSEAGTA